MIQELWDFITTKSTASARDEGYLYHSIALAHRARRCQTHWHEHLKNCHHQLLLHLKDLKQKKRVAVLGSGLLLETPAEILAQHFAQIDLVDVVHTKDVRKKISSLPSAAQFNLIELDLNKSFIEDSYDFVISANLLSQLPYVLAKKIRQENKDKKELSDLENEIEKMTFDLQSRHFQQVKSLSKNIFLFSDFEIELHDKKGKLIEQSPTVDSSLSIKWENSWIWNLAPIPEISTDYSVDLRVGVARF